MPIVLVQGRLREHRPHLVVRHHALHRQVAQSAPIRLRAPQQSQVNGLQFGDTVKNSPRQQSLPGNREVNVIHHPLPTHALRGRSLRKRSLHIRQHNPMLCGDCANHRIVRRGSAPRHGVQIPRLAKGPLRLGIPPQPLQRPALQIPQPSVFARKSRRLLQLLQRVLSIIRRNVSPRQ